MAYDNNDNNNNDNKLYFDRLTCSDRKLSVIIQGPVYKAPTKGESEGLRGARYQIKFIDFRC